MERGTSRPAARPIANTPVKCPKRILLSACCGPRRRAEIPPFYAILLWDLQPHLGGYRPRRNKSRNLRSGFEESGAGLQFTDAHGMHRAIRGRHSDHDRRRNDHDKTDRTTRVRTHNRTPNIMSGQERILPEVRRPPGQNKPLLEPDTLATGRYKLDHCKPGPELDRRLEEPQPPEPVKEVKEGQS